MLTVVLLLSGCGSSRKGTTEVARSDSLSTSVTEQTTYVPVPKRTATLSVSAEQWTNLARIPKGYGISHKTDGLTIDIESDGEGGVNVTATSDSIPREVQTTVTTTTNRIRDETVIQEKPRTTLWEHIGKFLLPVFIAIGVIVFFYIKNKLKK